VDSEYFTKFGAGHLPGYLGMTVTAVTPSELTIELAIEKRHMAPNGFLHAGTVIALADTACGYGCWASLPDGAEAFTTIETKSNHVGTARDGTIQCRAVKVHAGKTTQVWDAVVSHRETSKAIAMFRCTQMILYRR
jgi:1,4-dihydroxy-2-naphthoyl-CoA hydrolase